MTISAFDHPLLGRLLSDDAVAAAFAVETEIRAMLEFEAALARAEAAEGVIPPEAAPVIAAACESFEPDMEALAAGTRRDGMTVPNLIAQLRATVGEPHAGHVHFGSTSQDVIDSGLMLRLRPLLEDFDSRLEGLSAALARLADTEGGREIMGRTRMQRALPILLSDRIAAWRTPLDAHRTRLADLGPRLLALQLGGPVGTRASLGQKGDAVAARLAADLGLSSPDPVWHATRDRIAEFASWLSLVTGSLGKIGQDIVLMAQSEVGDVRLKAGGGSSAMAHKINPVAAEVLVALARFKRHPDFRRSSGPDPRVRTLRGGVDAGMADPAADDRGNRRCAAPDGGDVGRPGVRYRPLSDRAISCSAVSEDALQSFGVVPRLHRLPEDPDQPVVTVPQTLNLRLQLADGIMGTADESGHDGSPSW